MIYLLVFWSTLQPCPAYAYIYLVMCDRGSRYMPAAVVSLQTDARHFGTFLLLLFYLTFFVIARLEVSNMR